MHWRACTCSAKRDSSRAHVPTKNPIGTRPGEPKTLTEPRGGTKKRVIGYGQYLYAFTHSACAPPKMWALVYLHVYVSYRHIARSRAHHDTLQKEQNSPNVRRRACENMHCPMCLHCVIERAC